MSMASTTLKAPKDTAGGLIHKCKMCYTKKIKFKGIEEKSILLSREIKCLIIETKKNLWFYCQRLSRWSDEKKGKAFQCRLQAQHWENMDFIQDILLYAALKQKVHKRQTWICKCLFWIDLWRFGRMSIELCDGTITFRTHRSAVFLV